MCHSEKRKISRTKTFLQNKMKLEDSSDNNLLAVERQRMILDVLDRDGLARTNQLKDLLKVSAATIRSDLRELEKNGVCEIVWGGAVAKSMPIEDRETLLQQRIQLNAAEKKRIGQAAAQFVEVGQTIIVDAGSTTVELVAHLPRDLEFLRIVTPALNVAGVAAQFPNVELVMTGGVLRHLTRMLIGPAAINTLGAFNADLVFLAAGGFSIEHGLTNSNIFEVEVKRAIAQQGERIIFMADSSKYDEVRPITVIPLHRVDVLITDTGLSDEVTQLIQNEGVEVLRV
jgi:DeoR family fructose operon transcriptional repressor